MQTVNTQMTVTFFAGWQMIKDQMTTIVTKGRKYPNIIEFYKKDVAKAGKQAVAYLRKMLRDEIYNKPAYPRMVGGSVTHTRTGRFMRAATMTGPRRVGATIIMGIFNLRKAAGMKAHKAPLKYYDILEFGHRPYQLSNQQRRNYAMILRKLKKYDPMVARQISGIRGDYKRTQIGLGMVHPGIKPYKFFRRTAILLNRLMTNYGRTLEERYKSYALPYYKPKVIRSGMLPFTMGMK